MSAWGIAFEQPLSYAAGLRLQEALLQARIAELIPDTVLFLEHTPVISMGTRARAEHVLLDPPALAQRGIELAASNRGGDVTWHGPGQLVMYPIIRLGAKEADAHGYLRNLEECALRSAADFGVAAFRRPGLTGAWTATGKLAAIGIRLKRWVTSHGLSFNVCPDLAGFAAIVPCGLAQEKVTSLQELLGPACPSLAEVRLSLAGHFGEIHQRALLWPQTAPLPASLAQLLCPYRHLLRPPAHSARITKCAAASAAVGRSQKAP